MNKKNTKRTITMGIICVLLVAAASWYSITFNNSRLIEPTELSEYVFQTQDLPMIISGVLLVLYILHLFILLVTAISARKAREAATQTTRKICSKLGLLGFLGLVGFSGFWTYSIDKTIFPFIFFLFFGFFGFFYEGKMSNTLMDERYKENKMRASDTANKISLTIIFISVLILGQGKLMGNLEYTLIAIIIVIALSIALDIFLSEYLLYHYDHEEPYEGSEE